METYTIQITDIEREVLKKLMHDIVKNPKVVDVNVFDACIRILTCLKEADPDIKF